MASAVEPDFALSIGAWNIDIHAGRGWVVLRRQHTKGVSNTIGFPVAEMVELSALLNTVNGWTTDD